VQRLLFLSKQAHQRTYLILVKDKISQESIQLLRQGVSIRVKGGSHYTTLPCEVEEAERPGNLTEDILAYEREVPCSWLAITLIEGKYHQVRKMLAAVKHPVRRLIRVSIDDLEIGDLKPGEVREMREEEIFRKLKIHNSYSE